MAECWLNWNLVLLFSITFVQLANAIRCFYCATPGTKIAPQLWLHSEPCVRRRYTTCNLPNQACVVVKLTHTRLNFTVAGCSEDQFEGCDQFMRLSHNGPTALHMCQCQTDRCNSDFHLDFGASLGRIRDNRTKLPHTSKLPLLKKLHPVGTTKTSRDMSCADDRCSLAYASLYASDRMKSNCFLIVSFWISRQLVYMLFLKN